MTAKKRDLSPVTPGIRPKTRPRGVRAVQTAVHGVHGGGVCAAPAPGIRFAEVSHG